MSSLNPSTNDKILDVTKFKEFADNKLNVTKMTISLYNREKTLREKEEMLVTSTFSFSQSVSTAPFFDVVKSQVCGVKSLNTCFLIHAPFSKAGQQHKL